MIYEVIRDTADIFETYFEDDMNTVKARVGEPMVDSEVTIHPRRDGLWLAATEELKHPALGIYKASALTGPKWQRARETVASIVYDYVCRTPTDEPDLCSIQVELAAEAILMCVDRFAGVGVILGAGETPGTISIDFDGTARLEGMDYYQDRVVVEVPIQIRDQGLT